MLIKGHVPQTTKFTASFGLLVFCVFSGVLEIYIHIKIKMSWSGGDWLCGACQHPNFKKRESCQKCGYPKFGGVDVSTYLYNRTEVLAGDWYCGALNCGSHNYASRTSCYRCGMIKVEYTEQYYGAQMVAYGNDAAAGPPGWKTGDWVCPRVGCGVHNYASRAECFKCKTTRDYGGV
ncbi:hypothetical protein CARUB_v10024163mg [Capsella rubella]|uniref:RanBP2-type domain-containing protein n=2 Tax=Capsella rubella TaxID=81985 RepID=R0FYA1_9BRAS|nr:hypothetical protein CARUB_v10024163mg [Capsella rubella]